MKPSQSGGEIYPLTSRGMPSRKIRGRMKAAWQVRGDAYTATH